MISDTENPSNPMINPLKTAEKISGKQLKVSVLTTPFKKLAMALSGGGFRAAAYSLGAMSYLHCLKYPDKENTDHRVLDNVEFITSASGGTFAGILYTMHVRQGLHFGDTFSKLLEFLNGQVLLEDILKRLNDKKEWKGDKSRNLINAFSSIYDEKLFAKETFGVYWPKDREKIIRPIEVCFNATEFYRGLSFRFQASNMAGFKGKVGNNYIYFTPGKPKNLETVKKLKLGDILASSSCFPAGFEPILFPMDFTYTHGNNGVSLTKQELKNVFTITGYNNEPINYQKDIGLMDGGINDNQAVYSTILADRRRRNENPDDGFDLIFITDVASYFMKAYEAPDVLTTGEYRAKNINDLLDGPIKKLLPQKFSKFTLWALISLVIFLLSVPFVYCANSLLIHDLALILASCSAFTGIVLILLNKLVLSKPLKDFLPEIFRLSGSQLVDNIKKTVPALKNFSDKAIGQLVAYLQKAPIGTLEQMLKSRLNSMLSLVLEINLKQTRRLIFDTLYGNFYGKDTWQNRRVFNVIYELSKINVESRNEILKNKFYKDYGFGLAQKDNSWAKESLAILTSDCEKLQKCAEKARSMGTTLWTDEIDMKEERIRDVIACGQFTTCAKLLEYCFVMERVLEKQDQDPNFTKQIQLDKKQILIFQAIKKQLLEDWSRFKNEPYFAFHQYQGLPKV